MPWLMEVLIGMQISGHAVPALCGVDLLGKATCGRSCFDAG